MCLVFVSEYGRLPVTDMFDVDGNDTEDPVEANTVVVMLPNGKWLSAECYVGEIQPEGLS